MALVLLLLATWNIWRLMWLSHGLSDCVEDVARKLQMEHNVQLSELQQHDLYTGYGTVDRVFTSALVLWAGTLVMAGTMLSVLIVSTIRERRGAMTGDTDPSSGQ